MTDDHMPNNMPVTILHGFFVFRNQLLGHQSLRFKLANAFAQTYAIPSAGCSQAL